MTRECHVNVTRLSSGICYNKKCEMIRVSSYISTRNVGRSLRSFKTLFFYSQERALLLLSYEKNTFSFFSRISAPIYTCIISLKYLLLSIPEKQKKNEYLNLCFTINLIYSVFIYPIIIPRIYI